ncbi:uncharacterized protein LOC129765672 [Toxorhynchites rutilus septentrionalis]|uniref:uncharacterized protein LOC129765672 n=1 Tax=Toxorhynchites rutilus septentrionalis TaxID=329112 RepID=UPI002479AE9A|nr:uncharacterized protein LOC129765672 [Toxorhynchites rutilus septentrionalis]
MDRLHGPTGSVEMDAGIVGHHTCSTLSNQELHDLLRKTYTLEESVISAALLPESVEDRRAKEILEKTTVSVGDRFETGLLWKEDDPSFPDSYPMAVKRMQSMERHLQKDAELYEKVRCMIGEYLAKGYAHIATRSELKAFDCTKVWYIPLNIVFNPRKQKYRLVWDARAEVKGISLNSKLLKGPDMLTALPAVLCRFRERAIGFGADIKEMYHQMRIREADKRVIRFVFRNDPLMAPVVYVMDVATFGATCSPSSAQYVKNLNAKEYAGQFPEAEKAIVENHYVDDYFDSADTIEETVKRARDVRDSKTVLSWIHSDHRRYKQFVAFRIGEILNLTKLGEWHWVPTKCNVADGMTKWEKRYSLQSNGPWFRGPNFLYHPEESWPLLDRVTPNISEEMRVRLLLHDVLVTDSVVDYQRFSRWRVLVRTIACVFRFVSNCRRKRDGLSIEAIPATSRVKKLVKRDLITKITPLKREEYQVAEAYLWRAAQADEFEDEVKVLKKNRSLPYKDWRPVEKCSHIYDLSPFLDEQDVGHGNTETAVNEIRQRFRIQNMRAEMKRICKTCVWCKVKKCGPKSPRMARKSRVTPNLPPFTHTGVDYCGPFTVADGRRSEKRYVCLFTCMSTGAVHLEVAHSLTTQACLMSIRRFTCRRGKPLEFYSDNGTNFQAASKEIMQKIGNDIEDVFTDSRTRWNFNPPSSPHMGEVWERLVRSLKMALNVLNDGRMMTYEVLLTTLAEAEDLINSRPLTYSSLEPGVLEALTPNHFIRGVGGQTEHAVPPTNEAVALRDCYKRSQVLADRLWKRWITEYLPSINRRTKWHVESPPLTRGDLVYIADDSIRKNWIRGIVEETIEGPDGRIRQAIVRTAKGQFRRPVAKLEVQDRKSGMQGTQPELRGGGMCLPTSTI